MSLASPTPSETFFLCYKCSQGTMSVTPFGVYCQGCGLRAFTHSGETRILGLCDQQHPELVLSSAGRIRCLVCSNGGLN